MFVLVVLVVTIVILLVLQSQQVYAVKAGIAVEMLLCQLQLIHCMEAFVLLGSTAQLGQLLPLHVLKECFAR